MIEKDLTMKEPLSHLGLNEQQVIFGDVLEQEIGTLLQERGVQEQEAIVV